MKIRGLRVSVDRGATGELELYYSVAPSKNLEYNIVAAILKLSEPYAGIHMVGIDNWYEVQNFLIERLPKFQSNTLLMLLKCVTGSRSTVGCLAIRGAIEGILKKRGTHDLKMVVSKEQDRQDCSVARIN